MYVIYCHDPATGRHVIVVGDLWAYNRTRPFANMVTDSYFLIG
jgi:hypothetical protein